MDESEISSEVLKSLFPHLPEEFLEEFLRVNERPNEEIDQLFDLQEQVMRAGQDYKKTIRCIVKGCALKDCVFFHRASDMRRDPTQFNYDPKPCFAIYSNGRWEYGKRCPKESRCNFAHNQFEINLHPGYREVGFRGSFNRESYEERGIRLNERVLNELITEIREIDEIIRSKKENLLSVQYEIEDVQKLALCVSCCKEMLNFILPCGHLLCESCKNSTNFSCPVCRMAFRSNDVVKLAI